MANKVTNKTGWYISYIGDGQNTDIDFIMGGLAGISTPKGGETAIKEDNVKGFLILVGDWREHYNKCETFEEALEVYKTNIEQRSPWSEDNHLRKKVN